MILTCHDCSRQICFHGHDRNLFARLFGWIVKERRYYCAACGEVGE
ncbi:MAG: hypothetical protein QMD99_03960 [Rhizobiaceae bacterium]|nr:hypothetical protein [Rhizobiaceae bacterium]